MDVAQRLDLGIGRRLGQRGLEVRLTKADLHNDLVSKCQDPRPRKKAAVLYVEELVMSSVDHISGNSLS
jgi:hypothetical protein